MIPDRIIEQGTLRSSGGRAAVEVRVPWYRALPGSCIGVATLSIDGHKAPTGSLRWEMNGKEFTFDELTNNTEEWWFPSDSAVLSGDIPVADTEAGTPVDHVVEVGLVLYIPYIITDDGTLHIEEHDRKIMKGVHS